MPIIAITNGLYTGSDKIIQALGEKFDCPMVTDTDIIEKTHKTFNIKLATLKKVVEGKQIAFNKFTHEKEKCIAALKITLSDLVSDGNCIIHGFLGHLIPKEITHVMRVLIFERETTRIERGMAADSLSEEETQKKIDLSDSHAVSWTLSLFEKNPWDKTLYDRVISPSTLDPAQSVDLVSAYFKPFTDSGKDLIRQEVIDFKLSADVGLALSDIGQGLLVNSQKGQVVVTIDQKVRKLTKFQQKIIHTVGAVPGVNLVETKIGRNYYKNEKKQVTD